MRPRLIYNGVSCLPQEGRTPLHYAAALHDSGIFYRYLLKCGADEHIQDKVQSSTVLYISVYIYKLYVRTRNRLCYGWLDKGLQDVKREATYVKGQSILLKCLTYMYVKGDDVKKLFL